MEVDTNASLTKIFSEFVTKGFVGAESVTIMFAVSVPKPQVPVPVCQVYEFEVRVVAYA